MSTPTPYLILNAEWHKVSPKDEAKLICGLARPAKSESVPTAARSPKVCEGCKPGFPTAQPQTPLD